MAAKRRPKLPPLLPDAPGRPKDDRYRQQFGVIVICTGEAEQRRLYERFKAEGLRCKVVVT